MQRPQRILSLRQRSRSTLNLTMSTVARISPITHSAIARGKGLLGGFNAVFRVAAMRVRAERTLSRAATWLAPPILLSAMWVGLLRFTLLDLPAWPVLLPLIAWSLALVIFWTRTRVTTGQAARYLDHALDLDERLATFTEVVSRSAGSRSPARTAYLQEMGESALELVEKRMANLPRLRVRAGLPHMAAMSLAACLLALVMVMPTPLDAVRIERQKLAQSVTLQLQRIADLRADFVSRPQVSDTVRAALLAELDRLEAALKTPGLDRASLLAAIASTQERLRKLSPETSADFDPLIRAGQVIQEAAALHSLWSADTSKARSELGRAADASEFLATSLVSEDSALPAAQQNLSFEHSDIAQRLDGAAGLAGNREPVLSRLLGETSTALRAQKVTDAARSFREVAVKLREIEGRQQTSEAIESALSSLDDGKQSIAQTAETRQKKAQVGFRRGPAGSDNPTTSGNSQTPSTSATPGADTIGDSGGSSPTDSSDPRIGQNMPSFGGSQPSQPGSAPGSQPDTQNGSSGQTGDGTGSPKTGDGGSQPGSSDGTPQPGQSDGKLSGPVTGPGGGVTGGITKVENPEGVGVNQGDAPVSNKPGGPQDTVSLPAQGLTGDGLSGGEGPGAVPTPGGSTQGTESGAVSPGGAGSSSGNTGAGALATIRTPYTEVIGQYIERATAALERTYIPQDAKEYVRDYFTLLGK